tara:strand:+ start:7992 stop:8537 length:546 start_codon:yes stop_codon:yes gene_type:complete
MSNTLSFISKTSFKAALSNEAVNVHLGKFLENANSWGTTSPDENVREKSLRKVERKKENINKQGYLNNVDLFIDRASLSEREGAIVIKAPANLTTELEGVYDEPQLDEMEAVGTLLKHSNKWKIVTSLEEVEIIRRDIEIAKIKSGSLKIGSFNNADEYSDYLKESDAKNGSMTTRGHGIY